MSNIWQLKLPMAFTGLTFAFNGLTFAISSGKSQKQSHKNRIL